MTKDGKSVLVVDDSPIYRRIFEQASKAASGITDVSVVDSGQAAVDHLVQHKVDLVICDMVMPKMDGITTTKEILKQNPSQAVVVVSGISTREASTTLAALSAGALDFIPKPKGTSMQQNLDTITSALQKLIKAGLRTSSGGRPGGVSRSKTITPASANRSSTSLRGTSSLDRSRPAALARSGQFNADLVLIGISTGGPNALQKVIPLLPATFSAPILIVQHMPAGFTSALARQLDSPSKLKVKEAEAGERAIRGHVYISKGDQHLVVDKSSKAGNITLGYNDGPPENSCKPAVDVLYRSVSNLKDMRILSLILTGMGSDGEIGVKELVANSNLLTYSVTQSSESCVVYGMPRAVDEAGLSNESIALNEVSKRMTELVKNPAFRAKTVA